jgi:K+-transporting ATPase ATPase C chain
MRSHLRANLWLLLLTVAVCCIVYPAVLWAIGRTMFPRQSEGSLVRDKDGGQPIGSLLIAQPFTKPEYFWPRPSAVSYDAGASGGSNLAASNPKLRARVVETLAHLEKYPHDPKKEVPADLVMASGSGLDPHITLANARYQLDRVAAAWAEKTGDPREQVRRDIERLLEEKSWSPLGGLAGGPLVNVLEVNQALETRYRFPISPRRAAEQR